MLLAEHRFQKNKNALQSSACFRYQQSPFVTAASRYAKMLTSSSRSLKSRGFGLPACGSGVTDPISMNPKPLRRKPSIASPSECTEKTLK